MSSTVPLAEYLFTRLRQLGVESIHGVPGDYNLALLDYVSPGLHWVGNCNELNAGYAADAYSRIKGLGAIITTFGVGELSAANAIAGAYCELAPVVHIVGTPARHLQESRALIHHTLNDGVYNHFSLMAVQITIAQANLLDPRTCPQLIDSTIQQCLLHSRPVYLQLPADMVSVQVDSARLKTIIQVPPPTFANEQAAVDLVLDRMMSSKRPMILVDGESRAYGILDELDVLIKKTQWPTWFTIFGKSCVDESLPNVHGIWRGDYADGSEKAYIESSDLVLCFGPHFSNTNTYAYTSVPNLKLSVLFTGAAVKVGDRTIRDVPAKYLLTAVLKRFDPAKMKKLHLFSANMNGPKLYLKPTADGLITQDLFYKIFGQTLRAGDIILAETGTAGHGCRDFKLPKHTHLFKPSTWLSIGYMLPATQGAALAQHQLDKAGKWHRENNDHLPRTVLLIGDGSFQMTAQELSTIIKLRLNLLLILINNDGYTIERCLHGWDQDYNNIAFWRYLEAPSFFGAGTNKDSGYHAETAQARTWNELDKALQDDGSGPKLKMIEVFMDKEDAPLTLSRLLQNQKDAAGK